jgi:hypothetical protein
METRPVSLVVGGFSPAVPEEPTRDRRTAARMALGNGLERITVE